MTADPSVFVHPQGLCESDSVGPGTRIWAFAHVLPGAVIGSDCNICDHAFVEGGAQDGDSPEESGFFSVDTKMVLSDSVDLARPLLIALIAAEGRERPYAALIDGLQRLFKAAWRGIPELPAYVLTPDEERLCRI